MIVEEKLSEYFLEDVTAIVKDKISFTGWKVIGEITREMNGIVYDYSEYYIFQTIPNSWPEEFTIMIQRNTIFANKFLVLVSPECPEVYFAAAEEILGPIREILGITEDGKQEYKMMTSEELMKELERIFKEQNQNPYTPSSPSPWTIGDSPYLSNITCSSSSAIPYPPRVGRAYDTLKDAWDVQDNEIFYAADTKSVYVKASDNQFYKLDTDYGSNN